MSRLGGFFGGDNSAGSAESSANPAENVKIFDESGIVITVMDVKNEIKENKFEAGRRRRLPQVKNPTPKQNHARVEINCGELNGFLKEGDTPVRVSNGDDANNISEISLPIAPYQSLRYRLSKQLLNQNIDKSEIILNISFATNVTYPGQTNPLLPQEMPQMLDMAEMIERLERLDMLEMPERSERPEMLDQVLGILKLIPGKKTIQFNKSVFSGDLLAPGAEVNEAQIVAFKKLLSFLKYFSKHAMAPITELDFKQVVISAEQLDSLMENLATDEDLTSLKFSFNEFFGSEALPYLIARLSMVYETNRTLTSLSLSNDNPAAGKFCLNNIELFEFIRTNRVLTSLDLSHNNLAAINGGGESARKIGKIALANALKVNSTLTTLNLSHNNLSDEYEDIIKGLATNTTLTTLNLSHNNINNLSGLAEVLERNTALTTLDFSHNKIEHGTRGGSAICDALSKNRTLATLDLSDNYLFFAYPALSNMLLLNTTLRKINLSNNRIEVFEMIKLSETMFIRKLRNPDDQLTIEGIELPQLSEEKKAQLREKEITGAASATVGAAPASASGTGAGATPASAAPAAAATAASAATITKGKEAMHFSH